MKRKKGLLWQSALEETDFLKQLGDARQALADLQEARPSEVTVTSGTGWNREDGKARSEPF